MAIIRKIEKQEKSAISAVVKIHLETFSGFFLTFMGKGFLRQMYSAYTTHNESGLLVAFEGENPVGFLAYSGNMSDLYKHMVKTRLLPFAWYSIGAFFRKPKVFTRLIRAFLKPTEAKRSEDFIELSSIGVLPEVSNSGVGSALISFLLESFDSSKFMYINLETDACNNEKANYFYIKNGFILYRNYYTAEGRKMNEYHWRPESKKNKDSVYH